MLHLSSMLAEAVTFLAFNQDMTGFDLRPNTGFLNRYFLYFFAVASGKFQTGLEFSHGQLFPKSFPIRRS